MTRTCAGWNVRRWTPWGRIARGVAVYCPGWRPAALTSTVTTCAVRRRTTSWGPSTWRSMWSGTTRDVAPAGTPTTWTGTARRIVDKRPRPTCTVTVTCRTDAVTFGGSCSATRRLKSPWAALASTGAVGAFTMVRSTEPGPVTVTVPGSGVALVTASACGGVPTTVGTMGTTLLTTPSFTRSVTATIFGVTCTPGTAAPSASAGTTRSDPPTSSPSAPASAEMRPGRDPAPSPDGPGP